MDPFPHARRIPKRFKRGDQNYSVSTEIHNITVPDGKVWLILNCMMYRADSSTARCSVDGENTDELKRVLYASAGTGLVSGPIYSASSAYPSFPILAWENEYIEFQYGTAQSSKGDYIYLEVLEYDLKEIYGS